MTPLPEGTWPWFHDLTRWIGTWVFRPVFALRVHHRERIPAHGPVVAVANHSAAVDGPLLYGLFARRTVFWVKVEMFTGLAGWGLRRIGQLPVRRGEVDRRPLQGAVAVLRGGGLIGIFPEGTRGSGDVVAAQQGAAWLARTTGAAVLPAVIRGTRRPEGSGRRFRPRVDVLIGEPFTLTAGGGRAGLTTATEELRTRLSDLVRELDELRDTTNRT